MSFLLYKAKNSDTTIGYLQGVLPIPEMAVLVEGQPPQQVVNIKMIISWASFDPETGEVGPTPDNITSTTLEQPDDLLFLGSEEEFLSNFEVEDDDEEEEPIPATAKQ